MSYPDPKLTASDATPEPGTREALHREIGQFIKLVLGILLVLVLGKSFVLETSPVHGPSMEPTFYANERILVYKLPVMLKRLPFLHGLDPLEEGDFVVFRSEEEAGKRYIKRLIAKGPARSAERGVQAQTIEDPRLGVQVRFDRGAVYVNNRRIEEPYLQPGEQVSPDVNDAVLEPGTYYVLGDHRSVSKDSRRIGPVDDRQIVGKAVWRIWPLSKFGPL
jgi:signal peptidase I